VYASLLLLLQIICYPISKGHTFLSSAYPGVFLRYNISLVNAAMQAVLHCILIWLHDSNGETSLTIL